MPHSEIPFQKLHEQAILPSRGSAQAAGLDLYSVENVVILAGGYSTVKTGVATAVPEGYYGRIAPRSGLSAKHGIFTLAGVVDSDYRGELMCVLANHSSTDFEIKAGDRIAQFVIEAIIVPEPVFVENLSDTERGSGALGSTGY